MKKIISVIISAATLLAGTPALCVENTADFSDKLTVLEGLMTQCESKGIPTDYEMVNYKVIERFDSYMDDDIASGHMSVEVNLKRIDELYNEAKANLEGYLDGTRIPKYVTRSDMSDMTLSGDGFYDSKGMPVYSVGYGHFTAAANDIPNFEDFGASNIQIECGPTVMTDSYVAYIQSVLKNAEKYNIAVNLLLSPHYFPKDLDSSIYTENGGFIKYNIDAPEAREVIENYLRTFLPKLQGYKALTSLILSNEPAYNTTNFPNFYNPKFREYMQRVHGTIEQVNADCGTSYKDFSEIDMNHEEVSYDWMIFNDTVFADWHNWMADIVEEYLPKVPKSIKLQEYFTSSNTHGLGGEKTLLRHGVDPEMFNKFTDIAGNDALDYTEQPGRYFRVMFMYDYQNSACGKPIYNSEDHIIMDGSTDFSDKQRVHLRNNLWMGAIHGRDMSTIWVWDRRKNDSALENSILYRPECVAETGKTSLDLTRLSLYVDMFQNAEPKTAVFYSKASRWYQDLQSYMPAMFDAYKTCLNSGVKVGIISDLSIDMLSKYDTLIIPNAEYVPENTLNAVTEFAKNGGRVLYTGNAFSKNEYKKQINNSTLRANARKYSSTSELQALIEGDVYLVDNATGEKVQNVDWMWTQSGDKVYINASYIEFDKTKSVSVYKDGKKLKNLKDLISGTHYDSDITLSGYTPVLLEYTPSGRKMPEIINPSVDKKTNTISWTSNEDYSGAKIYTLKDGYELYLKTIKGNKFEYSDFGNYVIRPLNSKNTEGNKCRITVGEDKPIKISVNDYVKTSNSVCMEVTAENTSEKEIFGLIAIEMYDSRGNRLSGVYNETAMSGNSSETVTMSIAIPQNAVQVFASFIDCKASQNLYSNEIGKRF